MESREPSKSMVRKKWSTPEKEEVLCIEYEDGKYWHHNESGECW